MDKAERKASIYNEAWCKDLLLRIKRYKDLVGRIKILEVMLEKSTYPASKMVSTYGDRMLIGTGLGEVSALEIELREKKWEVQLLDAAMGTLSNINKDCVYLKHVEKVSYWQITDIYIPQHYKDKDGRPLFPSERAVKDWIAKSLIKMGEQLGYIGRLHDICTKSATQLPKKGVD